MINQIKNPTFGGFKPDAMQRIAGTLGYSGDMSGFQQYLANNPDKQAQMDQFKQAAMTMARGGADLLAEVDERYPAEIGASDG